MAESTTSGLPQKLNFWKKMSLQRVFEHFFSAKKMNENGVTDDV